ncbi:hypothetical protein I7I50_03675 [Histoplasma capsulatum G186AR]|uniref:Uncharacterized protein n=1 Tax=Ajellomyces capsulatus TaxID=5037 RepID=A0A8H7YNQ8_AJECA|nr:hypothetical protein I7I52_04582 [Histoplasma capsulatum]QSS74758.1 hypothetical protein I7I50_03675 [Histoplasma capsulatum G186AR]
MDNLVVIVLSYHTSVVWCLWNNPGFLQANTLSCSSQMSHQPKSRLLAKKKYTPHTSFLCSTFQIQQSNWAQRQKFDNTPTPQHLFFQSCILSTDAGCVPSTNSVGS